MDHSERVQGHILRHSAVKIPTDREKKTLPQPSQIFQFPILMGDAFSDRGTSSFFRVF